MVLKYFDLILNIEIMLPFSISAIVVLSFLFIKVPHLRLTMALFLCCGTAIELAVFMVDNMHFMASEIALYNCNHDL